MVQSLHPKFPRLHLAYALALVIGLYACSNFDTGRVTPSPVSPEPAITSSPPAERVTYGAALETSTPPPSASPPTPASARATATPTIRYSAVVPGQIARVTRVIDGDTIEVTIDGSAYRVRYIGINTPESEQPFGPEAAAANAALVSGQTVALVKDVSEVDKYGRLLRYVYVGDVFVNAELVRLGYAYAATYPPDVKYADHFTQLQSEARAAGVGLWEPVMEAATQASVSGANACPGGCAEHLAGCDIKGNISSQGEKIYHVPGGEYYAKTVISPDKGERWFCTEAEALDARWRKSQR